MLTTGYTHSRSPRPRTVPSVSSFAVCLYPHSRNAVQVVRFSWTEAGRGIVGVSAKL